MVIIIDVDYFFVGINIVEQFIEKVKGLLDDGLVFFDFQWVGCLKVEVQVEDCQQNIQQFVGVGIEVWIYGSCRNGYCSW